MIQIVPALPPAPNGVGDYALSVAREMRREFGVDTRFVVGNETWKGSEEIEGFAVRKALARTARGLEAALDEVGEPKVLLQLSGYGYSRRGCPFWLLDGLRRWRRKRTDARLATMFHELYASGPPWTSTFWVSPAQRMVAAGIARRSDVAVTNLQRHREALEGFDASKRGGIETLAVPSNVGEPLEPGELGLRAKSLVVFGLPGSRKRTYATRMAALQRTCEALGIAEIFDVGRMFEGIPEQVGGVPVRRYGFLGTGALSLLLSRSMAGFVDYSAGYLGKSGVFAAYCAHRMIPVVPVTERGDESRADGIECGVHYCGVTGKKGQEFVPSNPQTMADAAWKWYQGHTLKNHARLFAGVFSD